MLLCGRNDEEADLRNGEQRRVAEAYIAQLTAAKAFEARS